MNGARTLRHGRGGMYLRGNMPRTHPDQVALLMEPSGEQLTFAEYEANCNRLAHLFRAAGLRQGRPRGDVPGEPPALLRAAGRGRALRPLLHVHQLVPDARRGRLHRRQLRGQGVLHVGRQGRRRGRGGHADADASRCSCASTPTRRSGRSSPTTTPSPPSRRRRSTTSSSGRRCSTARARRAARRASCARCPTSQPGDGLALMGFIKQMFRFREGMTYLSPAPLYHSAPQASVSATMRLGGTSVIMERFDPEQYLALVERHRITHSQVVPTMFSRMLKLPDGRPHALRPVVDRDDHPRRRPVPGPGQAGHDRVVRPEASSSTTAPPRPTASRGATARSGWPTRAPSATASPARC